MNNNQQIMPKTNFRTLFTNGCSLQLECGEKLSNVTVAYQTYGKLNKSGNNVIMVNHALTGNAHLTGKIGAEEIQNTQHIPQLAKYNEMFLEKEGWWASIVGAGLAIDTEKYFVICSNVLGSCYGTTGPCSINAKTNQPYNMAFPGITVRDMVKVQKELMDKLGVQSIKLAIGGSLGGMQVLEWAIMYGNMIESIIPIGTSAAHSPWAIGLNEASRNAIINDPAWKNGNYSAQPELGIKLARKIAMISYRSYASFNKKFGRKVNSDFDNQNHFEVESYLNYQGDKLTNRFDANTYLYLSRAMDLHDVGRDRGGVKNALQTIKCKAKCVGINSDILYPVEEQKEIASNIPNSEYIEIDSIHGHDAFLIEFNQIDKIIREFLK